ncbi:MAG: hypothetical protein PHS64_07415 [Candidatus Omnitrophica bacterium]|nr:hypothetical protein [Candidatus Omnitrophota bacterium]MDD5775751.1 hypothetical protein [Candidatus Omnitrophota bacterium]
MKLSRGVGICVLVMCFFSPVVYAQEGRWENISREIVKGICVLPDPAAKQTIFLGTANGLYRTEDAGLYWKPVLHGQDMAIHHVAFDLNDRGRIFAATSKGIYAGSDSGRAWKNIFKPSNARGAGCRAIMARLPLLLAGTDEGLFVSADAGRHWNRESGQFGSTMIIALGADASPDGYLYAAVSDGVYRKKGIDGQWEKVFTARIADDAASDSADVPDDDGAAQASSIRALCVDPARPQAVYCAAATGIFASTDNAATWKRLPESGLTTGDIRAIAVCPAGRMYAATDNEVFEFADDRWHRIDGAIAGEIIESLACGVDRVYAAGKKGLHVVRARDTRVSFEQAFDDRHTGDLPSIASVQKAAIAYADADIGKIHQWRRQARNKALLPSVDFGFNKDTSDLWHWEGGSTTREYDDILRKGKDVYEWDVALKWDLADLIWNDAQTSIDTRSRLLVQLRGDIIDEVTKLYFEYVRVRLEMDSLTLMDKKKIAEKEIRLQELAAQLDGLTDNYFTRR